MADEGDEADFGKTLPERLRPPAAPIFGSAASQDSDPSAVAGTGSSTGISQSKQEFLWKTHAYINEYIRFSDAKAGFIIAISGALLSLLISMKSHLLFMRPTHGTLTGLGVLSALAFLSLTVSAATALLSVRPRLNSYQAKAFIYFGGVAQHASQESFYMAFCRETQETLQEHLAHHVYTLAAICQRKYFWISVSVIAVAFGALCAGSVLLWL